MKSGFMFPGTIERLEWVLLSRRQGKTLAQCAKILGVSNGRARQLEALAIIAVLKGKLNHKPLTKHEVALKERYGWGK